MSENHSLPETTLENASDSETVENINLTMGDVVESTSILDSWFIRASWLYKRDFLLRCLNLVRKEGLEQMVLLLGPPIKDYYCSLSGYTNNPDDIIPHDDCRQMDEAKLNKAMNLDYIWLSTLPRQQTTNILIGLTELSGSALRMQLYGKAQRILEQLHVDDTEESESQRPITADFSEISEDMNKGSKEYQSYKTHLDRYNDFIHKLKRKIASHESDKKEPPRRNGKSDNNKNQDTSDYLQLLPSWVNRKVLSYLDTESLSQCELVNSYWKNAVQELRRERDVRKKINTIIAKVQPADLDNIKLVKSKNDKKNVEIKVSRGKSEEGGKKNLFRKTSSQELVENQMIPRTNKDTEEMINVFSKSQDRLAFREQYLLIWTLDEYTDNRVLAIGKRWLAFNRGAQIVLCNLLSFANMPGAIRGHEGRVTALAFHPKDGQLISAGTDSTVRRWDVWSRQEIHNFTFPSVKDVVANENYYAVVGTNLIKVFCWALNYCQWTMEVEEPNIINNIRISADDTVFISYLPDNNIKRICAKKGVTLWEIPRAHFSRVTCLTLSGDYFLTVCEEGWINIWKSNKTEALLLANRNFSRKIYSAILHEGCVITALDNGELYIWDITTDELVLTLIVNEDSMPILNIHLLNYYDHCKVIMNSEMGIKVLQFMYKRKQTKKEGFAPPQTCRSLSAAFTCQSIIAKRGKSRETRVKEDLMKRQSCHPDLRRDFNKILTIRETAVNMKRPVMGELHFFPAIYGEPEKLKTHFEFEKMKDDNLKSPIKPSEVESQTTLKNFLPIHNPYKHTF